MMIEVEFSKIFTNMKNKMSDKRFYFVFFMV